MLKLKLKIIWYWLLPVVLILTAGMRGFAQTPTTATKDEFTVYVFLSETCPISQYYTLTLKALHQEFADAQVRFVGVFPNAYSSPETIAEFKTKYKIPFALQPDPKQELTKTLKAEITPEAVVRNETSNTIVYKGRIDDSYFRVGKRRSVVTTHDLKNALAELKNNHHVSKPETAAVGCYITYLP